MSEEHLAGPWEAVLADSDGDVYDSVDEAREALADMQDEEMTIQIVRGTALPHRHDMDTLRLPGRYRPADVAYVDVAPLNPGHDDAGLGAEARFLQAQAMALGLNLATEASTRAMVDKLLTQVES